MSNAITITTDTYCWSVDDARNSHLLDWEKVIDEARDAGSRCLELSPSYYIAIEQEGAPRTAGGVLNDLAASRAFLSRTGF